MVEVYLIRRITSGTGDETKLYLICQLPAIPRSGDTITIFGEDKNLMTNVIVTCVEYTPLYRAAGWSPSLI